MHFQDRWQISFTKRSQSTLDRTREHVQINGTILLTDVKENNFDMIEIFIEMT